MKILYLFTHDLIKHSGVTKKVISQTNIWKKLGHQVKICNISLQKSQISLSPFEDNEVYYRNNIFKGPKRLIQDIKKYNPDIIYFRFEPYKPYLGKILKNYKVIVELNTDDYSEMRLNAKKSLTKKIRFLYYLITRYTIYKNTDGFVAVTNEIENLEYIKRWNKSSLTIPNSIELEKYNILKTKKNHDDIPQLLFIGTPNHEWHGIDKIMKLSQETIGKLHFHIVGINQKQLHDHPNVSFYGRLDQSEYSEIVKKCDIGIGSLAFHRLGIKEACPLKVREYLAYGLPVIIAFYDSAFRKENLPSWILKIPNCEDNIENEIGNILSFCNANKTTIVTHEQIRDIIGAAVVEKGRLNFFEKMITIKDV